MNSCQSLGMKKGKQKTRGEHVEFHHLTNGWLEGCLQVFIMLPINSPPISQLLIILARGILQVMNYSWNSKLRSRMVRYSGCFDVILKSRIILLYNVNKIACLDIQSFDIFSHSMSIPDPNTTFRTLRLIHGSKSISQLSFAEVRKAVWVACVTQQ